MDKKCVICCAIFRNYQRQRQHGHLCAVLLQTFFPRVSLITAGLQRNALLSIILSVSASGKIKSRVQRCPVHSHANVNSKGVIICIKTHCKKSCWERGHLYLECTYLSRQVWTVVRKNLSPLKYIRSQQFSTLHSTVRNPALSLRIQCFLHGMWNRYRCTWIQIHVCEQKELRQ